VLASATIITNIMVLGWIAAALGIVGIVVRDRLRRADRGALVLGVSR
jgi:hypothetical protein